MIVACIILLHNNIMRKFESHVQIAKQCGPWKISNGAEKCILQALQFNRWLSVATYRRGKHKSTLLQVTVKVMLRPTVSQPVSLDVKHTSGVYEKILINVRQLQVFMWGALSDDRTGLSVTIAAGARQRSHSRVRVLLPFCRLLLVGLRWRYSSPPPQESGWNKLVLVI
jgi:hypothetical protein